MFPLILKLSTGWKSVVTFRPISVVPVETFLLTACIGGSVGDRIGLEALEKRRIFHSYRELNHESLVAQLTAWPLTPTTEPVLETGTL
jgi:hypothetical protein